MDKSSSNDVKVIPNPDDRNELLDNADSCSTDTFPNENESTLRPYLPPRQRILNLLHSTRYHVVVISLVVLDTLIVISELLMDIELSGTDSSTPEVLHAISLSLLSLFCFEILVKLYAYGMDFFTLKGEVFDAIVVIVALGLDSASFHSRTAFTGSGLVIVLRLWRVVRIQNSMVMSVHKAGERKLALEREARMSAEAELDHLKEEYQRLKRSHNLLKTVVEENNISLPSQDASFISSFN